MVDTNKILTVSYGTFSCTLEGFDDSFGTMKAIAEYFRDLAADDRYFGAEPPTPDAEMLARIAEKEISRRVEARMEENSIVLRADRGSILPLAMREAEAESKAEEFSAPAKTAPAAKTEPEVEAEDLTQDILSQPDGIADEMAPVAASIAGETTEDTAPAADLSAQVDAEADADEDIASRDDVAAEIPAEIAEPVAEEPVAEEPEAEDVVALAEAEDDANSVAAKLRRIRAVVSQGRATGADPLYSEDEHADDFLAETHQELEAALALDDAAEEAENAPVATDDADITAMLESFSAAEDDDEDDEDDKVEEDDEELFFPEPFEDDDEIVQGAEDEAEVTPDLVAEIAEPEPEVEVLSDDDVEDVADEDAPIRARIIKMKRVDFEAAVAAGGIEEEAQDDTSGLSAEEEEELLRELAAVEAELQGADMAAGEEALEDEDFEEDAAVATDFDDDFEDEDDEDEDFARFEADADEDEDAEEFARFDADSEDDDEDDNIFGADDSDSDEDRQTPFVADAESEMGRIFAEADTQLDEETGKGRRNAIAHLRAAVAAAKAEEGAGGKLKGDGPDTEAYRDDLANVVRPRRPEVGNVQTRRPEAPRPAPLKLVAEQRVDIDDAKPAAPVRPRRVAMGAAVAVPEDVAADSDFAEYAESVGAGSLPELLEAAAAYLSFVEGREQFSRPQLMTHVRQVEKDEFSREDGLRSFGQLLREGKIEKLEGGRFRASESISYRPDTRYAGE